MHIRNEPRDKERGPGSDTLAEPRSAVDDRDSGIAWSREPDDSEEWAGEATSDDVGAVDTRRVAIIDEAPADSHRDDASTDAERADAERVDPERVDTEQVDAERADTERVDPERVDTERADTERADAERADAERVDTEGAGDETAAGQPVTAAASDETTRAPEAEAVAAGGELLPGDVQAEPIDALWTDDDAQTFRARWREVQLRFVDDPYAAAQEAEALVGDAIDRLAEELSARREDLAGWHGSDNSDTEKLRMAVRRYREFLDRVLGL